MPKPKYNDLTMTLRLPTDLASQARRQAKQERRPLSEVIRELLRAWLAGQPQTAKKQTGQVLEINGNFNTFDLAPTFEAAAPRYQLAATVAQFADLVRLQPVG